MIGSVNVPGGIPYVHPAYTAATGVPTKNAAPGFGDAFQVSQPVVDGTGHVKSLTSRSITIPKATATEDAAGLMSAKDKQAVNGLNGLEVIAANSSDYDMDKVFVQGSHFKVYKTGPNTLNTPRAKGITDMGYALIFSYTSGEGYGMQLALVSGGKFMFQRRLNDGEIEDWKYVLTNVLTSKIYGNSAPATGVTGQLFFVKA